MQPLWLQHSHCTQAHCLLSNPTEVCLLKFTVRSPLIGYQVISRPHNRFSVHLKRLDLFLTDIGNTIIL